MTATALILPPGETLGGYRIGEVLGVGGMAVVYRAEQMSLNREVALKVLALELGRDEVFSERFRREGMNVARLDHPHVIPIYDAGDDKGRLFLAMRLVVGMTLAERMRAKPLSAEETLRILRPIADGLDAAHAIGLVHRDIKPQNILVTERGHPYLADFGVAKGVETAGLTAEGRFVGSFHYAAPEQVLGRPTAPATDVYALAAVLYQCLTGTVPYPRDTDVGVLYAQVNEPPPQLPLAEAREFNTVIARGMAKDAVDRYRSAGKLIAAAEHAVRNLPSEYLSQRPTFSTHDDDRGTDIATGVLSSGASPNTETIPPDEGSRNAPRSVLTTTNVQRKTPLLADTAPRPTRRGKRRLVAIAAGLAIVAGAIAGVLLNGGGRAAASVRVVQSGPLAITYRPPWIRTREAVGAFAVTPTGGAGAAAPIELASGGATLAAGSLVNSAAIPGAPPPALVSRFGHAELIRTRLASGSSVALYRWTVSGTRSIDTWVIPTVRGDLAIICSAPAAITAPELSCAAMATRVHVSGVSLLAVGPDVGLAHSLRGVVAAAAASRDALARMYRVHPPRPATTATSIARADSDVAMTLSKLEVPARYKPVVSGLAVAFVGEAQALTALAHAAGRRDRRRYAIASGAVTNASRKVTALSLRARNAGLLWSGLAPLNVPKLPVAGKSPAGSSSTSGTPSTAAPSVGTTTPAQTYTPPPSASSSGSTTSKPSTPSGHGGGGTGGGSGGGHTVTGGAL